MSLVVDPSRLLEDLLALHTAVPGVWSTEIRHREGFDCEVIFHARADAVRELAQWFGLGLRVVDSVDGKREWTEAYGRCGAFSVCVAGPSSAKDAEVCR